VVHGVIDMRESKELVGGMQICRAVVLLGEAPRKKQFKRKEISWLHLATLLLPRLAASGRKRKKINDRKKYKKIFEDQNHSKIATPTLRVYFHRHLIENYFAWMKTDQRSNCNFVYVKNKNKKT
jgi:hypothetical protein